MKQTLQKYILQFEKQLIFGNKSYIRFKVTHLTILFWLKFDFLTI